MAATGLLLDRFYSAGSSYSPHESYSGLKTDLALYDQLPLNLANRQVSLTSNETGLPIERPQREVLRKRFAEITAMDRSKEGSTGDFQNFHYPEIRDADFKGAHTMSRTLVW